MKLNQAAYDMIKSMPPFNPEMRKVNREGKKTQTRRVVKLPKWSTGEWKDFEFESDHNSVFHPRPDNYTAPLVICKDTGCFAEIKSPYGYPTELRYMREPMYRSYQGYANYLDDNQAALNILTGEPIPWTWKVKTLSSMYMPKFAARTFKRYEFIRVERLQDISKADCIAEGMQGLEDVHAGYHQSYAKLWDSLNAERGYPWVDDPYVWVVGYADDQVIGQAQFLDSASVPPSQRVIQRRPITGWIE